MTNLEFLETWYRRVWSEFNESAIDEMLEPIVQVTGLEGEAFSNPEAFKMFHKLVKNGLKDMSVVVLRHVSDGEWIAASVEMRATTRISDTPIQARCHVIVRIRNDRIVEGDNMIDFISVFEQIGIVPARALDRCLLGQRLEFVEDGPQRRSTLN